MILQDHDILFRYNGTNAMSLVCNAVIGGEIGGEVLPDLDLTLEEIWQDEDIRMLLEIQTDLTLVGAMWFSHFIAATDKVIILDGHTFEIVNDFDKLKFGRWHNINAKSSVKAKFKRRIRGFPDWS